MRGGQRCIASVDRELQFPDSSSSSFYITWAVSSQGLKNLAIYGNNYGTESSRQRRRKREKILTVVELGVQVVLMVTFWSMGEENVGGDLWLLYHSVLHLSC